MKPTNNIILFYYLQGNASGSSTRCSTPTQQVTKVTATAKFKVEVHTPSNTQMMEPPTRPVSSASSRRSSRSSQQKEPQSGQKEPLSGNSSVHSSLSDSIRSSLSSNEGGDAGFSEK
jgi:hypothetical protein